MTATHTNAIPPITFHADTINPTLPPDAAMRRAMIVCFFLALVLCAGCACEQHAHGGKLMNEHRMGGELTTRKVPFDATYVLYHWPNPPCNPPRMWVPENEVVELFVRGLKKNECIGFERDGDGKLFAVAGDERIQLEEGRYCWHIHPKNPHGMLKWVLSETGDRIVQVVSLPFGLAACVLMVPTFLFLGLLFTPLMFFWV